MTRTIQLCRLSVKYCSEFEKNISQAVNYVFEQLGYTYRKKPVIASKQKKIIIQKTSKLYTVLA